MRLHGPGCLPQQLDETLVGVVAEHPRQPGDDASLPTLRRVRVVGGRSSVETGTDVDEDRHRSPIRALVRSRAVHHLRAFFARTSNGVLAGHDGLPAAGGSGELSWRWDVR